MRSFNLVDKIYCESCEYMQKTWEARILLLLLQKEFSTP